MPETTDFPHPLGIKSPSSALAVSTPGISKRMSHRIPNSVTPRSVMTLDRINSLLRQGFGQGRNEEYIPWIRITRGASSPHSNQLVAQTPVHRRGLHLLAAAEFRAVLLAAWLGAREIREQFPLWPEPFVHPMAGLDPHRDRLLPEPPGLMDIARDAGIDHGHFVGAPHIPYVATTDLVLRIGKPPGDRLVFWSCKPREVVAKANRRVLERLELERRYACAIGAQHRLIDGTEASKRLVANIDWLMPLRSEMVSFSRSTSLLDFSGRFEAMDADQPLRRCITAAATSCGLSIEQGDAHFRAAAWLGLIDVNLFEPILMSRSAVRGGCAPKEALRLALLGAHT